MNLTIATISKQINATFEGDDSLPIDAISIDSRSLQNGPHTLFFALIGPNNDAHLYINDLIQQGVTHFVVQYIPEHCEGKAQFLVVQNTLAALQDLASYHRSLFHFPVIGVTGSNGKTIGFGVERDIVDSPFSRVFVNFSHGFKGVLNSDFRYDKIQVYYKQPFIIGPLGRTNLILEAGKTFGTIPLGLMSVIPGNQTYFSIENTFNNLNFYEFISDQYVTLQWNHNFQGRLFARIPFMRKLNWREVVGIKGVYGTISDANRAINASGLPYVAPENIYWEYSAGIGNIFKVFRIDFAWRGSYLNTPDAQNFTVKGTFGFNF
jgi:hypothetical protein